MKLVELLMEMSYKVLQGTTECEILEIVNDSRKVQKGDAFICIAGAITDGHQHIKEVIQQGVVAIVCEQEDILQRAIIPHHVTVILVENTRCALAQMATIYYGAPSRSMYMIGITGTKGKTTTTYMIKSILENAGYKVGLIGTVEVIIGHRVIHSRNTTPESILLQQYLAEMKKEGCDVVVMEVSSQGLMLHRTTGIVFDYGVFTNLGQDHIGPEEHVNFENYKYCKSLLFRQCKIGIGNGDDPYFTEIFDRATCKVESYGFGREVTLRAEQMQLLREEEKLGVAYQTNGVLKLPIKVYMPGRFSVYNSLAAIAVCRHFKVSDSQMLQGLKSVQMRGRVERITVAKDYVLLIDYAHNALSLESLLTTLRLYQPHRLVCVFGCGGNRARGRRYQMGEVAGRLADFTIITSDNPRKEDPQAIIDDVRQGMLQTFGKYVEICSRREAIRYAIEHAEVGDIIVLAGKGHETYQEIQGIRYPLDEREIVREILQSTILT